MGKNKKQIMALLLSGLLAFDGSMITNAAEITEETGGIETLSLNAQSENEKSYNMSDLLVVTKWGSDSKVNEDGSVHLSFPEQYNQIFYQIPADVDVSRLEKIIVNVDDASHLSIKLPTDNTFTKDAAVVYGSNSIATTSLADGFSRADLKYVCLMSLSAEYEINATTITFVLGEQVSEQQPGSQVKADSTYRFDELEQKAHWNVETQANEDGTYTFTFPKVYGATSYAIPAEIDMKNVESVVCNVKTDASSLSVKLFTDLEMQKEVAVIYGGSSISIDRLSEGVKPEEVKSFAIMGLSEGYSVTIDSVTFKMKNNQASDSSQSFGTYFKNAENNNPIVTQRYSADPAVMVYEDTVYVYSTNDIYEYGNGKVVENTYSKIKQINCFSSTDMVNWTDHGAIEVAGKGNDAGVAKWANNSWAPCAAHKTIDGKEKFFLYFADNGSGIGVLTADSPEGPFTDPLGKQLIAKSTPTCDTVEWLFDPAVLVDDDGSAYLYFGGGVPEGKTENPQTARVVKLGEDMISLDGDPVMIDAPYLFEDSGINKIGDTYYYSYCTNWNSPIYGNASIAYMTSDNPMGPFTFQGVMFKNPGVYFGVWGNNHHALFEKDGKYYLAYHARAVETEVLGENLGYRSTQIDEVKVENGEIKELIPSMTGVSQTKNVDPYVMNQAECFAREYGVSIEGVGDTKVCASEGTWIGMKNVDFAYGVSEMTLTASSNEDASIEIRTGNAEGTLLGTVEIPSTNGELKEFSVKTLNVTGERNLFFVFKGNVTMDSWQAKTATVYTFDQLTKADSYGETDEVKENGSLEISYADKWQEIRFEIPENIDPAKLKKVTVNVINGEAKNLSIKLLQGVNPATEIGVAYQNNELEVPAGSASNATHIGIMNMAEGEASYQFGSIVFDVETQKDAGEKGTDVQTDIPDLKDAIEEKTNSEFITGVSIAGSEIYDAKVMGLVTKHFNAVTIGNELKPDATFGYASTCPGKHVIDWKGESLEVPTLDFSRGEKMLAPILEWNENHPDDLIKIRGHVLVWHSQTPEWFFHEEYDANKPYVSAEEMTKREEWYIKSVLEHYVGEDSAYKDMFYGWDVVNEAVSDGRGTYRNGDEKSSWWKVYGSNEFIINAFRFANLYAPADVELYYNDYNEWVSSKVQGICQLLTDVKNAEGTRIDGMGMQGHYATAGSPTIQEFKDAATAYAAIVGKVMLTELDLSASQAYDGTKATLAAEYTRQAYRYQSIYQAVLDLRESGIDFAGITIWGVIDKNSWLQTANSAGGGTDGTRKQCPLLFDDYYQAKPAYWAFVDATQLEPEIKSFDIVRENAQMSLPLEIAGANVTATVEAGWTEEEVKAVVTVKDATLDEKDGATMYIHANGITKSCTGLRKDGTELTDGYSVEVSLSKDDFQMEQFLVGEEIKIDFMITNGNKKAAYNDYTFAQERTNQYFAKATLKPFMTIVNGTAVVDGEMDAAWEKVEAVPLLIDLGSQVKAEARLMWDAEHLYSYIVVKDPVLNADSQNAHEKDSVEIFIDENNHKSDAYEEDDKQYRINYKNECSFNGKKCLQENMDSKVVLTEDGYVVEAAFDWTDITPEDKTAIGIEIQINDADQSGKRIGTLSWYDQTGMGWSKPSVYGTAVLTKTEQEAVVTEIETELGTWISGNIPSYGKPVVNPNEKRIVISKDLVESGKLTAKETYRFETSNPAFFMYLREVKDGKMTSVYLRNGESFTADENAQYYAGLYSVSSAYKDLVFADYVALFREGMKADLVLVPGEVPTEISMKLGEKDVTWVSGNYGLSKATLSNNVGRMSLNNRFTVSEPEMLKAELTEGFRLIVRVTKKDSLQVIETKYLVNGSELTVNPEEDYYITLYATDRKYKDMDFETYARMIAEKELIVDLK